MSAARVEGPLELFDLDLGEEHWVRADTWDALVAELLRRAAPPAASSSPEEGQ